jgi:NAD(P)-dependent dehydrogenase (short-subunit alcohol dehydrogenase family)
MPEPTTDPVEPPFGEPSQPVFGAPAAGSAATPGSGPVELSGQLAVVTGATGLVGSAIAAELSARGARVCLIGRDLPGLRALADRLGPAARTAVLQCDLALSEDVVAAVDFVERLDRPVDLVVHAAGLAAPARIADGPVEQLDEHYLLNVRGPYLLSQRLLPLLADGRARCVFVAAADVPGARPGDAHHVITTAAGRALAAELRVEAARRGIRVLTVVADDEPGAERGTVDEDRFSRSLAANVVDALSSPELDVTEVRVRGVARPVRSEQR